MLEGEGFILLRKSALNEKVSICAVAARYSSSFFHNLWAGRASSHKQTSRQQSASVSALAIWTKLPLG
jgi:hypothetical protein